MRLLALRALGLGDLLTGVPALRALRRSFPQARLIVATPAELAPLLAFAGIEAEVRHTRGLEGPLPAADLAVDLHGRGPESHRLLLAAAPRVVGFAQPGLGVDGPEWDEREHERLRWCRLLEEGMGLRADPEDHRLPPPGDAARRVLVIHPGAASPSRRWPWPRFAAVARWAEGHGLPVVITGNAAEAGLARRIAAASGGSARVLAGRTDLLALAGIAAEARCVLVGDTGMAHLAAALGTPTVQLFGPTSPARWGPTGGPHTVLWRGREGDPHGAVVDPGLAEIGVAEVIEALRARLAAAVA